MELNDFVKRFAEEFDETPVEQFSKSVKYKDLEEWGSLTALSIVSMVDEEFGKRITGEDLRSCNTIEELYNLVLTK